jgi:hypothetical protein
MKNHSKPILLIALALVMVGVMLLPQFSDSVLWAQFSPPPTPTETPTITPTLGPTPTKVKRVINEIVEPLSSDAVAGVLAVRGTALTESFHRYDIHISPAGMEAWTLIVSSYEVIHDDVLARFNTRDYPDGFYDLRARAIADDGNYTEFFVRGFEIRNARPPTLTPVPGATPTPPSPLATPTPTPDVRRIEGGPGFYGPDTGAVLRGSVDIVATVNGQPFNPFERFELAISRAGLEEWTLIISSQQQAWQQPIYRLETTRYPDGLYDLRLRVIYRDSNYSEFFLRNLSIANQGQPQLAFAPPAGFVSPRSGDSVRGVVDLVGTVPAEDLLRWELAWSPTQQNDWRFLVSGTQPVQSGVLARLDLSLLAGGTYDFRLRVVRMDSNYTEYFVNNVRVTP